MVALCPCWIVVFNDLTKEMELLVGVLPMDFSCASYSINLGFYERIFATGHVPSNEQMQDEHAAIFRVSVACAQLAARHSRQQVGLGSIGYR